MTDKQIIEPFYCEKCNKCSSTEERYSNLKVKNNTGWTHDIYCLKIKQIIIDEQMENLNNLATQQLKRIEEEKRQIEHIAKTHLVETFEMQREIDKLKKELQAKEQECEELKNELIDVKWKIEAQDIELNDNVEQLDQLKAELTRANCQIANDEILQCDMREVIEELKAENEELKRENELAKQLINWILKFFELTDYDWQYDQNEISSLIEDCMDDKQSTIDFVTDINKELLAKLAEIKEIAEHCIKQDICTTCDNSEKCHIENEEIPTYDVCKLILQKISECEGNDEIQSK